jgi:hypothetical protein
MKEGAGTGARACPAGGTTRRDADGEAGFEKPQTFVKASSLCNRFLKPFQRGLTTAATIPVADVNRR